MPLNTNLNVSPYFDDFDPTKNYSRILFRPGTAVQARELTQLQTTLQDQIKKFGDHIFQTGSIVTGGSIVIQNTAYLNIASTFSGQDINYIHFDKQTISNAANTKRAYILKSYAADTGAGQPITFIINQMYGEPFTADETIYTQNTDPTVITYYANTASSEATGNCQSFSINEGVIYYDGFFVKTQPQTVAVDKYSRQGNSIIGFTVSEDLIDYTEDTTLLDPAQGSSNFQAPGADRYKILMTLDNRTLDSTDLTKFVEMGVIENGVPLKIVQTPIYAGIADELARRTNDESGDYVIKNFAIAITDSAANSAYANISLGSGKAYIKGYEFSTGIPTIISVPKPRTTVAVNNHRIGSDYGYYVFANGMFGNFPTNQYGTVELSLLNTGQIVSYLGGANTANYANAAIGNAKIKLVSFYAAAGNTSDSNNYIYKVFLTDINTKPIVANNNFGANAIGGSNTAIFFDTTSFASNNNVYKGLTVRMVGGTPSGNPGDNTSRIITDYVYNPGGVMSGIGVTATSTGGQFTTNIANISLVVGQSVNVYGTVTGSGAITGYVAGATPVTYYIIATNGSTVFQLSSTPGGSPVATTVGVFTGANFNVTANGIATVDRPYSTAVTTNHRFILDSKFESAESLFVRNGSTRIASANISPLSKNESVGLSPANITTTGGLFQPVAISDSKSEPLLIKVGEANIADNTISDFSYSYRRLYQTVTFTSDVSQTLSLGTGETLQDATTTTAKQQYYQVIVTSQGTGAFPVGKTVDAQAITVSTSARTITVAGGGNMTANIYAVVNASAPSPKTKTFIKANTQYVDPAWGIPSGTVVSVFGSGASGNTNANVALNDGQTTIAESIVVRTPGVPQYLYVSDVHSINAIFDLNGANLTQGTYNTAIASASSNVTSRYVLNTGQKDSYYDWSSIVLKPGQTAPRGPLVVRYNRFSSSGSGYFNVDSYTKLGSQENGGSGLDYGEIPIFTSQDGYDIPLKDYLDFRPVRTNATTTARANNFVLDVDEAVLGPKISEPGLDIITDYQYYLPRIDRVVLNKNRQFQVLQGTPSTSPVSPVEPDDAMTLYILTYPPYLTFPSSTSIQTFNNRRYTMKDIGLLDKRISNLELYTSLSIAELATLNKTDKTIRDSVGVSRPKNGIFVDSFTDKDGALITSPDFNSAIDIISRTCRGSYNIASTKIFSNNTTANYNVEINGPLLLLSSSNTAFVTQNKASKTMNINPFNIVNYIGTVKMDPPSDVWHSTNRLEAQNIDLSGGAAARDAWSSIQSTTWGAWNTNWTTSSQDLGTSVSRSVSNVSAKNQYGTKAADTFAATGQAVNAGGGGKVAIKGDVTTVKTTSTRESQSLSASRTGILAQIVPQQLTQSFGDRLIDLSIVTYMREKNVLITAEKFKPFTTLHAFFDNVKVDDKIAKVNRFQMFNNNLQYQTQLSNSETVTFYNVSSNTGLLATDTVIGTGGVVLTSNNNAFITNMAPDAGFGDWSACATNGIWVKGNVTGLTYRVDKWYHSTGRAIAANTTSVTLAYSAGGSSDTADYVGQTLYIVNGLGKGQSSIITNYNPTTRVATITGSWTTTPDTTSVYTIGLLETTAEGSCAGVFLIPADTFRTGEKVLRLIDDEFGNIENSRTNGDFNFFAQGIVDTKQETSVTVFTPTVQRSSVTESFSASTSSIKTSTSVDTQKNVTIGYYDPLAQTFLINPNQYGQGIVIDSIRVCFKSKDLTEPVTCQIRPVQNGYPSASTIYPFAEKTLTPDKVITTTIPDVTDSTKYTEFKFDVPILLLPGEHSFVLVSNSNGYECFIGEIGATDLATSVKISEQPYTGSLFLSQNGSTWSPEQMADIMFSIQKRVFTTGTGYGYFEADISQYSSNTVFDVMQLMTTDAVVANTAVQYDFISEMTSGGQHQLLTLVPNEDYECDDGYGRRLLSTTTGNSTFQLRISMQSTNQDISPMIDINRLNLLTIENLINNMPLQNTGFVITNQGSSYASNADVTLSYASGTPGQGSGGAARAVYDSASGKIVRIELTNAGTGYITSPTVTISGGSGSGATAVYNGEDKASGGNSNVRYITKKVQLAPGFEAGDLRVYLDAYRPSGSGILVYYKLLSDSDSAAFEDNNWNLMTEGAPTVNFISQNKYDYAELTFAPGTYGSNKFDNKVLYTSANGGQYKDFSVFAIKVVMYGTSTVDVPKISQLRVIALPASTLEAGS